MIFLNNLGELYFIDKNFKMALKTLREQYFVAVDVSGENSANVTKVINNIAQVTNKIKKQKANKAKGENDNG